MRDPLPHLNEIKKADADDVWHWAVSVLLAAGLELMLELHMLLFSLWCSKKITRENVNALGLGSSILSTTLSIIIIAQYFVVVSCPHHHWIANHSRSTEVISDDYENEDEVEVRRGMVYADSGGDGEIL